MNISRTKGSKNKSTLARERDVESKPTPVVPVAPVVQPVTKIVHRSDAEFLIGWLEGVRKEYKEDKKSHEEALNIINEILKYIKRHRPIDETKESSNAATGNDVAAN